MQQHDRQHTSFHSDRRVACAACFSSSQPLPDLPDSSLASSARICFNTCPSPLVQHSKHLWRPVVHPDPTCRDMGYSIYYFQDGEGPCAGPPPPAPPAAPAAAAPSTEVAAEPLPMRTLCGWVAGLGNDAWGAVSFTAGILSGGWAWPDGCGR